MAKKALDLLRYHSMELFNISGKLMHKVYDRVTGKEFTVSDKELDIIQEKIKPEQLFNG